jgi:hypothetical protein
MSSIFNSLLEEFGIEVLDFSELLDCLLSNPFVCFILLIGSILGVLVRLDEITQETENGIDGIVGFGSCLEESQNLIMS